MTPWFFFNLLVFIEKNQITMKQRIDEVFNIKTGMMPSKGGKYFPVAYIDDETSETTYPYRSEIKKKYGATWLRTIGKNGVWGWFLSNDEEGNEKIYKSKIKPCLEYLMSVEQTDDGEKRDVLSAIDELHKMLIGGNMDTIQKNARSTVTYMSRQDIDDKLLDIKQDIINAMSAEDFKKKIEPILKRRAAMGYHFSLNNTLLIMVQDPEATDVRSRSDWEKMNREVVPNATAICLFVRTGDKLFKGKEQRKKATDDFLNNIGKSDVNELTPGEKERLRHHLNKTAPGSGGFKFLPNFFDVRFTKQIEGQEDLYGGETEELQWNNDKEESSEGMEEIINAALKVAQDVYKLNVSYKDESEFGGALGYATAHGEIALRKDFNKNLSNLSTIVHEMSHCLLHFKYAQSKNPELKDYFVGTSQGRALVEQQAEISAYIILKQLGFDEEEEYHLNYIAGWGGSEANVSTVFDTVASAANEITSKIINELKNNNEYGNEEHDV